MATKIDDKRVTSGRLIKVLNENKHRLANEQYYSVWVEDADGSNERCLLFTENEIRIAEERAAKNPEDLTSKGFFASLF